MEKEDSGNQMRDKLGKICSFLVSKKHKYTEESKMDFPSSMGIYGLFLAENSTLFEFGKGGQVIYIGIAKNLKQRDYNQHFNSRNSGSSTLRRSIGAVLKAELKLNAIPRGNENDKKRFDNYKFCIEHEERLISWMIENLRIAYWVAPNNMSYSELRNFEKKITIILKPTLDLDRRTKKYNVFATELEKLRNICKIEAGKKI